MISNQLPTEKFLDLHSSKYEKVSILGDVNVGLNELHMHSFSETYYLKSLIKKQIATNIQIDVILQLLQISISCIDLILTNVPRSFQSTCE